jgi:hypothetical protein
MRALALTFLMNLTTQQNSRLAQYHFFTLALGKRFHKVPLAGPVFLSVISPPSSGWIGVVPTKR